MLAPGPAIGASCAGAPALAAGERGWRRVRAVAAVADGVSDLAGRAWLWKPPPAETSPGERGGALGERGRGSEHRGGVRQATGPLPSGKGGARRQLLTRPLKSRLPLNSTLG